MQLHQSQSARQIAWIAATGCLHNNIGITAEIFQPAAAVPRQPPSVQEAQAGQGDIFIG
ncbi:hypothetical protein PT276_06365 [Orbaceae bacterium ESL0721]|nr:hypothetical protein [Orbaceae bacterium ESL0721]